MHMDVEMRPQRVMNVSPERVQMTEAEASTIANDPELLAKWADDLVL